MTLSLAVLSSPVPQPLATFRLESGRAVLGRGEDCDWRLEDPGMFVSRHHCVVEVTDRGWTVTDTSSGGLFLDEALQPLGQGRSASLRDGMRLRMGDLILGVELGHFGQAPEAPRDSGVGRDPFFDPQDVPPPVSRPADLPPPFERPIPVQTRTPEATLPGFDDPFTLDPLTASREPPPEKATKRGMEWDWGPPPVKSGLETTEPGDRTSPVADLQDPEPEASTPASAAAVAAFLRGAGLDPDGMDVPDFEALGRRYRMMTEGLVALLRARSEEKAALRVAPTLIGAQQVNPLKFLVLPEEQVAAVIAPRGPGYLDPDATIAEAFRDLADHRVRSWKAMQAALRRMINRFSPEAIEAELADTGQLRALLAGGRAALLWKAYAARWAETARAAEDRFLGEVGPEFRDTYETPDRREP